VGASRRDMTICHATAVAGLVCPGPSPFHKNEVHPLSDWLMRLTRPIWQAVGMIEKNTDTNGALAPWRQPLVIVYSHER